jgi:hypothetical protein
MAQQTLREKIIQEILEKATKIAPCWFIIGHHYNYSEANCGLLRDPGFQYTIFSVTNEDNWTQKTEIDYIRWHAAFSSETTAYSHEEITIQELYKLHALAKHCVKIKF